MSAQDVTSCTNQAILARQRVRERWGVRHDIIEMLFAPAAIAGSSFSLLPAAPAWFLTIVAAALSIVSGRASEQMIQPVPPGEPAKPRLTHVCLISRLLPIPRAAWR